MVVKKNQSGVLELFITKKRNWFSSKLLNNFGSNMAGTLKHTMEGLVFLHSIFLFTVLNK